MRSALYINSRRIIRLIAVVTSLKIGNSLNSHSGDNAPNRYKLSFFSKTHGAEPSLMYNKVIHLLRMGVKTTLIVGVFIAVIAKNAQ